MHIFEGIPIILHLIAFKQEKYFFNNNYYSNNSKKIYNTIINLIFIIKNSQFLNVQLLVK
jgi:hypothetical protein